MNPLHIQLSIVHTNNTHVNNAHTKAYLNDHLTNREKNVKNVEGKNLLENVDQTIKISFKIS